MWSRSGRILLDASVVFLFTPEAMRPGSNKGRSNWRHQRHFDSGLLARCARGFPFAEAKRMHGRSMWLADLPTRSREQRLHPFTSRTFPCRITYMRGFSSLDLSLSSSSWPGTKLSGQIQQKTTANSNQFTIKVRSAYGTHTIAVGSASSSVRLTFRQHGLETQASSDGGETWNRTTFYPGTASAAGASLTVRVVSHDGRDSTFLKVIPLGRTMLFEYEDELDEDE